MSTVHMVIPDTQSRPGTPDDHFRWIADYLLERRPDVVIHLGDHWDMSSLSTYDRGKMAMEGRRYSKDVDKGNADLALLTVPLRKLQARQAKRGEEIYDPRLVLLRGNHEWRIKRAVEEMAQLDGTLRYDEDLESPGWEVHDFLEPVFIDGIGYSHFWANPLTGRPYGGMIQTRLKTIGHSFTMGHQQTLDIAVRYVHGPHGEQQQRGLVAGSCYLHAEAYRGLQGNAHWRGIIVKHEVCDGAYGLMEVSLDFLCRKYEGIPLAEFVAKKYPDLPPP